MILKYWKLNEVDILKTPKIYFPFEQNHMYIVHSPTNALFITLEKFKIYIKININIVPTSFGLRSSIITELVLNLAKVIFMLKHSVKLSRYMLFGDVAACHRAACVFCAQHTTHTQLCVLT